MLNTKLWISGLLMAVTSNAFAAKKTFDPIQIKTSLVLEEMDNGVYTGVMESRLMSKVGSRDVEGNDQQTHVRIESGVDSFRGNKGQKGYFKVYPFGIDANCGDTELKDDEKDSAVLAQEIECRKNSAAIEAETVFGVDSEILFSAKDTEELMRRLYQDQIATQIGLANIGNSFDGRSRRLNVPKIKVKVSESMRCRTYNKGSNLKCKAGIVIE